MVLLEQLPDKLTRLITHKVKKVVYPCGDVTDPITGKKVSAAKFRDDEAEINKVYGENETAFNYDKAPPRGWQEEKKDFTHVETYIKYHEDGKDQPHSV